MQSVNRRIAALFYASVMKVLKVRPGVRRKKWFHRQISATRTTRYYEDFFIISKTNLSLSWLENLVRLCDSMLPSDKIALKHLPSTISTLFAFIIFFTICIYHTWSKWKVNKDINTCTVGCVLFINNFEHYFLQGSLVLNKKLMNKYCKLVSLLSST